MILAPADKLAYWAYWFLGHFCGIFPYDWRRDWNFYLAMRRQGMSPWRAWNTYKVHL